MDYKLLIRVLIDFEENKVLTLVAGDDYSEGEFLLEIGDTLTFSIDSESPESPGDYVVVAIPRSGIVQPEDQFLRVTPDESKTVEIWEEQDDVITGKMVKEIPETPEVIEQETRDILIPIMLYSEKFGCSCLLVDEDNFAGPVPKPVVRKDKLR